MEGRTLAKRCAVRNRHPVAKYKGGWTEEEDQLLNKLVHEVGQGNWSPIARELNAALGKTGDGGRIGKQCRERWNHHLRPDIKKEPWTAAEEKLLVAVHRRVGNRWSKIARALPGRSENGVKNHWNATMRKREPPKAPRSPLKLYMIEIGVLKERPRGRSSKGSKSAGRAGKRSASPVDSDALTEEEADRDDDREEEGSFSDHEQTQAADGFTQEAPPPSQHAANGGSASALDESLAAASMPMGSVVGCERAAVPKVVLRLRRQVPLLEGLCTEEKLPGSCDQAGLCLRSSPVKAPSGAHPTAGSCEEAAELLRPAKRHCSGMGAGVEAAQRRSPAATAAVGPSCITTGSAAGFTGWLPAEAAAACLRQDANTGLVPVTSPTAAYSTCMPDTCGMHGQAAPPAIAAAHAIHMMPAEQHDRALMAVQQQQQQQAAVFTGHVAAASTTCSPTIPVLEVSPEQQQQQGFCLVSNQAAAAAAAAVSAASDVHQHCSFQEAAPWSPADMSTLVDDPETQFDWWNLPSLMDDEFELNDASLFFDYDSDLQPDLIPCQPDACLHWKATSSTACGTTSPVATSQAVPPYPCSGTAAWDGSSSNNSYGPSEADRLALYNARCASTMAALASCGTLTTGRSTLPVPCLDNCLTAVTTGGLLNIPKLSTDVPAGFGGPDSPLAGFGARAVGMPRVDSFCSTTTSGP